MVGEIGRARRDASEWSIHWIIRALPNSLRSGARVERGGRKISEGVGVRAARMVTRRGEAAVRRGWPGFTRKHKREMGNVFRLTIRSRVVYIDSNVQRASLGSEGKRYLPGNLVWSLRKIDLLRASRSQWLGTSQAAAREKGGVCLADAYVGSAEKYPFRCAVGHEWVAIASQIWLGRWCRQCTGLKLRQTIDDMRALAAARGGLCLSTEYQGRRTKLTWQCHRGHVWESRPINISAGTWCPQCAITNRTRRRDN